MTLFGIRITGKTLLAAAKVAAPVIITAVVTHQSAKAVVEQEVRKRLG